MQQQQIVQQSTVDYFQSKAFPSEVVNSIGEFFTTSPVVYAAKKLNSSKRYSVNGLGQPDLQFDATGVAIVAALMVVTGVFSYQAGKAMAPTKAKEKSWGWIGVPVGMIFGSWGLGTMGAISNARK